MQLEDYIKTKQEENPNDRWHTTIASIARRAGCSRNHLSRVINGHSPPSLGLARKIEAATDGNVTVIELLTPWM